MQSLQELLFLKINLLINELQLWFQLRLPREICRQQLLRKCKGSLFGVQNFRPEKLLLRRKVLYHFQYCILVVFRCFCQSVYDLLFPLNDFILFLQNLLAEQLPLAIDSLSLTLQTVDLSIRFHQLCAREQVASAAQFAELQRIHHLAFWRGCFCQVCDLVLQVVNYLDILADVRFVLLFLGFFKSKLFHQLTYRAKLRIRQLSGYSSADL